MITGSQVVPSADSQRFDDMWRVAPASLISLILHLVLLICFALFNLRSRSEEQVVITISHGFAPSAPKLESIAIDRIELDLPAALNELSAVTVLADKVEVLSDFDKLSTASVPADEVELGIKGTVFNDHMSNLSGGEFAGVSADFSEIILDARKHGIEIVIVFDSTSSMSGEIELVKRRIETICEAILERIPEARFSLVTYRDRNDAYVVRGISLGNSVSDLLASSMT